MIFKEENTPDAYLVNAQMKKKGEIILTWTAIGDRKVQPTEDGTTFVVESPKLKYLLKFDSNGKICYIIEYKQKEDLNGYCYYTKHKSDKLKECGLVKNDKYIPFKEFEHEIMKEYTYSFDNDHIVVDSKEMVHEGAYQDNPSEHYPRVVPNALEKLPELPKNVKEAIITGIIPIILNILLTYGFCNTLFLYTLHIPTLYLSFTMMYLIYVLITVLVKKTHIATYILSLVIFVLSIVNNVKFYYTASPIYPSDLFFLGNIDIQTN